MQREAAKARGYFNLYIKNRLQFSAGDLYISTLKALALGALNGRFKIFSLWGAYTRMRTVCGSAPQSAVAALE